jgi:hypothetical protein
LVNGLAQAAAGFQADLIVLGLDRRRLCRRHFSRSMREQLAQVTALPVMISPADGGRDCEVLPRTGTASGRGTATDLMAYQRRSHLV